jgi:hypothetical protein
MKSFLLILLSTIVLTSCYQDKEELLYPKICDIKDTVSYASDIVPILRINCYNCHSSARASSRGANIKLDSYENASNLSSSTLDAIKHNSGSAPMPKNSRKLTDCDISTFEAWVLKGSLNN